MGDDAVESGAAGGVGRGVPMRRHVNPDNAILPVLLLDNDRGTIKRVLGTAFFFSQRPVILGVAHVLCVSPGQNETIAVPSRQEPDAEPGVIKQHRLMARLENVRRDPSHDLAVANVPGVTHFEWFSLRHEDPSGVTSVMTYDLVSRMTIESSNVGQPPLLTLTPYVWKGYVHAILTTQEPGMMAPAQVLEVSLPVVEGMSGAPLVDERTLSVVGVLFGNRARSLVPAPQAISEGQSWYLPIGQALHWSHARDFLNSIGETLPNTD